MKVRLNQTKVKQYCFPLGGDFSETMGIAVDFQGHPITFDQFKEKGGTLKPLHPLDLKEEFIIIDHPNPITKSEYDQFKLYFEPTMDIELTSDKRTSIESMGEIDPECRELVIALNRIEGVKTVGSCSGHNKSPLEVNLYATPQGQASLAKIMDRRYGGPRVVFGDSIYPEMCAELYCLDLPPFSGISLHTRHLIGKEAYAAANRLTRCIYKYTDGM